MNGIADRLGSSLAALLGGSVYLVGWSILSPLVGMEGASATPGLLVMLTINAWFKP